MSNKPLARSGILAIYVAALLLPVYMFFHDRGGTAFLHGLAFNVSLQLLFPLLGLYAFTFVTWQVLLATNLWWLRKLWPNVIRYHRFQGSFALLFALLHPAFIVAGFGLSNYLHFRYTAPALHWWLAPAYAGLTIMIATVLTAHLAWIGKDLPWWRKLHRLNYLVFALVWLHSWFIGSDMKTPLLQAMWVAYALAVIASTVGRYYPALRNLRRKESYA